MQSTKLCHNQSVWPKNLEVSSFRVNLPNLHLCSRKWAKNAHLVASTAMNLQASQRNQNRRRQNQRLPYQIALAQLTLQDQMCPDQMKALANIKIEFQISCLIRMIDPVSVLGPHQPSKIQIKLNSSALRICHFKDLLRTKTDQHQS